MRVFRRFHKGGFLERLMARVGLVLTMGKNKEHAITAIQRFNPRYLALITGSGFAKVNRRRMTQWKKQFDLDGDVFVIEDLFGGEGAQNMMNQTFLAIDALRSMGCQPIHLGITGGTMHMAGIATSVATVQGMQVFYVKQPDGEQVVQPNKDVLLMPNISSVRAIQLMPAELIDMLYKSVMEQVDDEQGVLSMEEISAAGLNQKIMEYLVQKGLFERLESTSYELTFAGYCIVKFARQNPNIDRLLDAVSHGSDAEFDHMFG